MKQSKAIKKNILMNLIINASSLSASGVTQVATSFIYECKKYPDNNYFVFLSSMVSKQINQDEFADNFKFYCFNHHPFYGIKGYRIRKKLIHLEKIIKPDVVFSIFGPSWWTPKAPHLQGYAYPHYVYKESPIFDILPLSQKIKLKIQELIHQYFLNKNGSFFVSETEDVSLRLKNILPDSKNSFFSVSNTCNAFFYEYISEKNSETKKKFLPEKSKNEFQFLSLCTYHSHKNLNILNKVIPILNNKFSDKEIKFILTINDENFKNKFSEEAKKSIINIGRIDVKDCPKLYKECDALFLPTLLECFSANYPEAMIMEKPIITSNLSFATSVCGAAALYFNPMNEEDIVSKIIEIIENDELRKLLVKNGKNQLRRFLKPQERAFEYIKICKLISL